MVVVESRAVAKPRPERPGPAGGLRGEPGQRESEALAYGFGLRIGMPERFEPGHEVSEQEAGPER